MRRMFIQNFDPKVGKSITFQHKQKPQKYILVLFMLFFVCFFPALCFAQVMVTLPPLASVMHMLDEKVQIQCILGNNSDPHHMSISPRQFEKIKKALVLRTVEDKRWTHLKPKDSFVVWKKDYHAWLQPQKVHDALPHIAAYFEGSDVAFQGNLAVAQAQVMAIEKELKKALEPLKKDGVIMGHGAWLSVFEAYGVPVRLVLEKGSHHGQSASPKRLQEALHLMDEYPNIMLLGDQQHDTDALQWLKSKRESIPLIILDTLGNCQETWSSMMQKNIILLEGSL